jgi:predicted ATP-binding protein involved in virulence
MFIDGASATLVAMSIQELIVEDLFDEFTHKITFKAEAGLTILHGPNGVGKTTVLKVLDLLFNRRFSVLRKMPLSGLQITFTEGDRLQITKKRGGSRKDKPIAALEFILTPSEGRARTWTPSDETRYDFPLSAVENFIPELTRIGQHEWINTATGEALDLENVLEIYGDRLSHTSPRGPRSEVPDWLAALLNRVPVYFIETERLSSNIIPPNRTRRPGLERTRTPTVLTYADDLSEKIKKAKADYGDYSQTLDSTFPTRFLEYKKPRNQIPSDVSIRERYAEQAARRMRYVKAGLLDSGDELKLPDKPLDESERRMLDAYLTDVDHKLNQLDDMADKLELFLQIVNNKFRRKSIVVEREKGLRAITDPRGENLDLTSLSSGEQQEVVLSYGLLFRENPGTLILLDEPEISLHVSWQTDLIPDLLKISEFSHLEFLIATHSPQIINDRWDLTCELSDDA